MAHYKIKLSVHDLRTIAFNLSGGKLIALSNTSYGEIQVYLRYLKQVHKLNVEAYANGNHVIIELAA